MTHKTAMMGFFMPRACVFKNSLHSLAKAMQTFYKKHLQSIKIRVQYLAMVFQLKDLRIKGHHVKFLHSLT
jgi:hypothetical protein